MNCPKCGSKAKYVGNQSIGAKRDSAGRLKDMDVIVRMFNCINPKCDTSFIHPLDADLIDELGKEE